MHTWKKSDLRWNGREIIFLMSTPPPLYNLEKKRAKAEWTHPRTCEDFKGEFFSPQIGMREAWGKFVSIQTYDKSENGCFLNYVCEALHYTT